MKASIPLTTSWDSRETLTDVLVLVGLGMLFYGLHRVFPALAFIVTGALVFALGVTAAYIRAKPRGLNAQ